MRRQIREPKVTIDRRQLGRQPAIVATGESPQMMMRIDPHQRITDAGTGASVSGRTSAPPRPVLLCLQEVARAWLGREGSNLRMAESKSAALPLGYAPTG